MKTIQVIIKPHNYGLLWDLSIQSVIFFHYGWYQNHQICSQGLGFLSTHDTDPLKMSVFITDPHHACKISKTERIVKICRNCGGNGTTKPKICDFLSLTTFILRFYSGNHMPNSHGGHKIFHTECIRQNFLHFGQNGTNKPKIWGLKT